MTNETVTAFLKVSHNLVRTGMYSFLFVRLGIMSRGPDRTFQGGRIWPAGRSLPITGIYACINILISVLLSVASL